MLHSDWLRGALSLAWCSVAADATGLQKQKQALLTMITGKPLDVSSKYMSLTHSRHMFLMKTGHIDGRNPKI